MESRFLCVCVCVCDDDDDDKINECKQNNLCII